MNALRPLPENDPLRLYEADLSALERRGSLFSVTIALSLLFFLCAGVYLKSVKRLPQVFDEKRMEIIKTRFLLQEKKKTAVKKAAPLPAAALQVKKEALDLTKAVRLAQKENDIVEPQDKKAPVVERVYGLRRVYSIGLGAGGDASEAVIGKLGNTINKEIDTVTAKKEQLEGRVVSVTAVTSMPVMEEIVKPEYTEEMKKAGVAGVIRVKILIDTDGRVKEAEVQNDLGYGSKESALAAVKKLRFKPAMQGKDPVAVWILISFKYVLQN
ncbi:MAG: energy transducer TonB [Fibrobacterota bacterium]